MSKAAPQKVSVGYRFEHLQTSADITSRNDKSTALLQRLHQHTGDSRQILGVFSGVFGIANNELFCISRGNGPDLTSFTGTHSMQTEDWLPTARPTSPDKFSPPHFHDNGIYVFRRFVIEPAAVEEFVALSVAAWRSFEHDDKFITRPEGLFQPPTDAQSTTVAMMLVTWYASFASWEQSRTPATGAAQNFRRRAALTQRTWATATRLQPAPPFS